MIDVNPHVFKQVLAAYGGDIYNIASTDTAYLTVGEADTATTLNVAPAVVSAGAPVTLSGRVVTVTPGAGTPTGYVTILNRGTPISTAALLNGAYTTTVSTTVPGTYTLHAVYTGDAAYAPSLSPSQSVTIQRPASP